MNKESFNVRVLAERQDGTVILAVDEKIYFYIFPNHFHWIVHYEHYTKLLKSGVRKIYNKGTFLHAMKAYVAPQCFVDDYIQDLARKNVPELDRSKFIFDIKCTDFPYIDLIITPKSKSQVIQLKLF